MSTIIGGEKAVWHFKKVYLEQQQIIYIYIFQPNQSRYWNSPPTEQSKWNS